MPLYTLVNRDTDEVTQEWISSSEIMKFLEDNPNMTIDFSGACPGLHSGIGLGVRKPDEGFKDLLGEMKKEHNKRGGKVNDFR